MSLGALGQVLGGLGSAFLDYKQNSLNRDLSQAQFNEQIRQYNQNVEMANTAHQREVKDLTAAGLNPILSGTGGGGLGTVGTSSNVGVSSVGIPDLSSDIGSAYATYRANKKLDAELDQIKENVINTAADTDTKQSQILLNKALASQAVQGAHTALRTQKNIEAVTDRTQLEAAGQILTNRLLRNQLPGSEVEAKIDSGAAGSVSRLLKRFLPISNSASTLMYRARD